MYSSTADQHSVSFTEEDLEVFSSASGDRNPLHLSREYAQQSPYGQRVVFGCLAAMACLGRIQLPAEWSATSLKLKFQRPLFLGVNYHIETFEKSGIWRARLSDGSVPVVSVTVKAAPSARNEEAEERMATHTFRLHDAAIRQEKDIVPGVEVSGVYAPHSKSMASVLARWGKMDRVLAEVLSFSSYLVGMELPGQTALFSMLALHFEGASRWPAVIGYRASVASVDSRFGRIEVDMTLFNGDSAVASGKCWSHVWMPIPETKEIYCSSVKPNSLAGRTAILIGSSRGLGAAIKRALELRGAAVYGMSRSRNLVDTSLAEIGDATDKEALRRLRARVLGERGRLDFLICSACPPVLPLRLEANAADRIAEYITAAVSLTLAPLSEFLEPLDRCGGCAVIISSAAVEQNPVMEWAPHYVAAKQAVEALGRIASLQYSNVGTIIIRPPKLLTTMTNTPLGRLGAASPALVAELLADSLERKPKPGTTEILGLERLEALPQSRRRR